MHRIDTPDATTGSLFSDGNPAVGQEGTIFDAAWLNDMQETLANPIEHAGIALTKGDYTQLTQAILTMIAGVVGSGGGSVPTTRKVLGGGLVTGGGTLDVDETLTVTPATSAEVRAGTVANHAIAPDQLAAAFGGGGGDSGTIYLPGGKIIKYGGYDAFIANEGQIVVTFDAPFPTACRRVFITGVNATANVHRDIWPQRVSKTAAGFVAYMQWTGDDSTQHTLDGFDYWAIGD